VIVTSHPATSGVGFTKGGGRKREKKGYRKSAKRGKGEKSSLRVMDTPRGGKINPWSPYGGDIISKVHNTDEIAENKSAGESFLNSQKE